MILRNNSAVFQKKKNVLNFENMPNFEWCMLFVVGKKS